MARRSIPFPGLRPFDLDQHRVFFGRSAEVRRLTTILRSPADRADATVLVVVGPSGCGKSSLVRAGLLPEVADEPGWSTLAPMQPGTDPLAELVRQLATAGRGLGLEWTVAEVRRRLTDAGLRELVDELLLAGPPGHRRHLLLVVDQLEELLTQTPAGERARFVGLLGPALDGSLQVVATIRPEFLEPLLSDAGLAALPLRTSALRPLDSRALRLVIEKPARAAGIAVEDDLVARMVADTETGDALPLLAYTLAQLAEGVGRGDELSSARYDQLGGVRGTLTRQADLALGEAMAATGRTRDDVVRTLLRLVTVDEHGRPTRWRVAQADLPASSSAVLQPFVARRLVNTDSDATGAVAEVAHEAFLSAWEPLATAVQANTSALRARRSIEQAASEWAEDGHPSARLWEGGHLASALADVGARTQRVPRDAGQSGQPRARWRAPWSTRRRVVVTDRVALSPSSREFLRAGVRRDRSRRGRSTTILSLLLVLAVAGAGVAVAQLRVVQDQRDAANAETLGRLASARAADDPDAATQLALLAYRADPTSPAARSALSARYAATRTVASRIPLTPAPIVAHGVSADGSTTALVTEDGAITVVRDVLDPARAVWTVPGVPRRFAPVLSPDGRWIAGSDPGGTVLLWDVAARTGPVVVRAGSPLWPTVARTGPTFSPDSTRLAYLPEPGSGAVRRVQSWSLPSLTPLTDSADLAARQPYADLLVLTDNPAQVVLGANGEAGSISPLTVHDAATGAVQRTLPPREIVSRGRQIGCADRGADPKRVGSSVDAVVRRLEDGAEVARFPVSAAGSSCIAGHWSSPPTVSADGDHLLQRAVSLDEEGPVPVRVTSLATGAAVWLTVPPIREEPDTASDSWPLPPRIVTDAGGRRSAVVPEGGALTVTRPGEPDRAGGDFATVQSVQNGRTLRVKTRAALVAVDAATGLEVGRLPTKTLSDADAGASKSQTRDDAEWQLERSGSTWTLTRFSYPQVTPDFRAAVPGPVSPTPTDGSDLWVGNAQVVTLIGGVLTVWDARTGTPLRPPTRLGDDEVDADRYRRTAAVVERPGHPDQIAIGPPDGRIEIRDLRTLEKRTVIAGRWALSGSAFDRSGMTLYTLDGTTVGVWDADTGQPRRSPFIAPGVTTLLADSTDGYLVSMTEDRIEFWDTERGVVSGGYSTGRRTPYGDDDHAIQFPGEANTTAIALTAQAWRDHLCAIADRPTTAEESRLLPPGTDASAPCH